MAPTSASGSASSSSRSRTSSSSSRSASAAAPRPSSTRSVTFEEPIDDDEEMSSDAGSEGAADALVGDFFDWLLASRRTEAPSDWQQAFCEFLETGAEAGLHEILPVVELIGKGPAYISAMFVGFRRSVLGQ